MKKKKNLISMAMSVALVAAMLCTVFVTGAAAASEDEQLRMAQALFELQLFNGYDNTGTNFGLKDVPSREQALIFQIRALGEDAAALAWRGPSPYTDVSDTHWALPYIGYATEKGYTKGIGGGLFGIGQSADMKMMATFILRGMGYSDGAEANDFTYATSVVFANDKGICENALAPSVFVRGDAAVMLYNALDAKVKNEDTTLSGRLIKKGLFNQNKLNEAKDKVSKYKPTANVTLGSIGNSVANSNNLGIAVTDGNYMYYVSLKNDRIDRVYMDNSVTATVIKAAATNLNLVDGWIYYSDDVNNCIAKVKVNGTGQTVIAKATQSSVMHIGSDGWIYFSNVSDSDKLYKMKMDGSGKTKLIDKKVGEFILFNDRIIYQNLTDGSKLSWVLLSDTKIGGTFTSYGVSSLDFRDGMVYFTRNNDDDKLYRIGTDGKGLEKFRNETTGAINFVDGKLFFTGIVGSKGYLHVQDVAKNTAPVRLINDYTCNLINVVGDYVFYTIDGTLKSSVRVVSKSGKNDTIIPGFVKNLTDPVAVTSVSLSKTTASIKIGETVGLEAYITPPTATDNTGKWTTSNSAVATVSSSGVVKGVKAGSATITFKSTSGSKTATCKVTVTAAPSASSASFEIYNLSGKTIKELYMSDANNADWGNNLMASGATLKDGYKGAVKLSFFKTTKYDILVKYEDGTEGDFRGLSFADATTSGGAVVLEKQSATMYPIIKLPVKLVNNTGEALKGVYATSEKLDDWGDNLVKAELKPGETLSITMTMIAYDAIWDIRGEYGTDKSFEFKGLDFANVPTTGTTIYLTIDPYKNNEASWSESVPATINPPIKFNNKTGLMLDEFRYSAKSATEYTGFTNIDNGSGATIICTMAKGGETEFEFSCIIKGAEYKIILDFKNIPVSGAEYNIMYVTAKDEVVLVQVK